MDIKSSVIKDKDTGLYKLILPGIERYFEAIMIYRDAKKIYGVFDENKISNNLFLNNKVFCLSSFFDYKIACFIDLSSMQSDYFFFIDSQLFNFKIDGKQYFCFVYSDYKGKILFYSDYVGSDFILKVKNKKIILENSIFGTNIFEKDISNISKGVKLKLNTGDKNINYLDIVDFYIFDDYFIKNNGIVGFYNFLNLFFNKKLKIDDNLSMKINIIEYKDIFMPRYKLNISINTKNINNISLFEIKKLLVSFLSENTLSYIIDNDNIKEYFTDYITDISKYEIGKLDINYTIPTSIYITDNKFIEFKKNILFLRYNYFKLKENIYKLNNINNINEDFNISFSEIRGNIIEKDMRKTLILYEQKLNSLLSLIKKYEK